MPISVCARGTRLTKQGLGFPQYLNDDVIIPGLVRLGYAPEELLAALEADFAGYEDLRRQLMAYPKMGNNEDSVDAKAALLMENLSGCWTVCKTIAAASSARGREVRWNM